MIKMPVTDLNANNFEDFTSKKQEGLVVVDFWHEQCPWCVKLNPEFEKASSDQKILDKKVTWTKFNILETPENRQIAMKLGVMSTPTIMFFCHGRPVGMTMGFQTSQQLHDAAARVVKQSEVCINKSSSIDQFYV